MILVFGYECYGTYGVLYNKKAFTQTYTYMPMAWLLYSEEIRFLIKAFFLFIAGIYFLFPYQLTFPKTTKIGY